MLRSIPLSIQVDMIFRDLQEELCGLTAGTVFLHIEKERVAHYGVRHRMENRLCPKQDGTLPRTCISYDQIRVFRELAAGLMVQKKDWIRGTVSFKFRIQEDRLQVAANYVEHNDECIVE